MAHSLLYLLPCSNLLQIWAADARVTAVQMDMEKAEELSTVQEAADMISQGLAELKTNEQHNKLFST